MKEFCSLRTQRSRSTGFLSPTTCDVEFLPGMSLQVPFLLEMLGHDPPLLSFRPQPLRSRVRSHRTQTWLFSSSRHLETRALSFSLEYMIGSTGSSNSIYKWPKSSQSLCRYPDIFRRCVKQPSSVLQRNKQSNNTQGDLHKKHYTEYYCLPLLEFKCRTSPRQLICFYNFCVNV